jgi:serine hydrolase
MAHQPVLFVHAGGDPRHPEGSGQFIDYLGRELGDEYQVIAPTMPNPDEPHYRPWRDRIEGELGKIKGGGVTLVGHSFGGSVLMKYLAEGSYKKPLRAVFLVSAPYWGPGGWGYDEYDLPDDFPAGLPPARLFLYHSESDPEVPFAHLRLYADKLPDATSRPIPGSEHSFTSGLPQLVSDIRSL